MLAAISESMAGDGRVADTGLKNRWKRSQSRANCLQRLGQQSLDATLPRREQFVPCCVYPHWCAPHQDATPAPPRSAHHGPSFADEQRGVRVFGKAVSNRERRDC